MKKNHPPNPFRFQVVDLARSFSILVVMAGHFRGFIPPAPPWDRLLDCFQSKNHYGVCAFFTISGFLITRLVDQQKGGLFRPGFQEFYVRRAARLFPLLLLMVILGIGFTFLAPGHTMQYLYCFKPLESWFDTLFWASIATYSYNWYQVFFPKNNPGVFWGLLWSLAVEEQFYLFYPPLLRFLKNARRFVGWMAAVILFGWAWRSGVLLSKEPDPLFSVKASFGAFDQIAAGCLLYILYRKSFQMLSGKPKAALFLCLSGFFINLATFWGTSPERALDHVLGPGLIALGTFLFLLGGLHAPVFESRFFAVLGLPGKYSYGLYLFHMLVFYMAYPWLLHFNVLTAFLIYVVLTTGVGAVCYRFFELPANLWVRGEFGSGKVR